MLQSRVDVIDDRELRARFFAGGAERVADGARVRRAQLKPVSGVDLDCVDEPTADELGASDQWHWRADILLQQMKAIHRRVVIRPLEVIAERVRTVEQPHAEAFAAAVRLEDRGTTTEALPGGLDEQFLAGDKNSVRGVNAGGFESGVLTRLADLEVERAAAVDDAPPVLFEPSQHRGGQFGGVAMVAGVRRGAHPIVEDTRGRRPRQIEDAAIEKPVPPGERRPIERGGQRFEPGRVLVDHAMCVIGSPRCMQIIHGRR